MCRKNWNKKKKKRKKFNNNQILSLVLKLTRAIIAINLNHDEKYMKSNKKEDQYSKKMYWQILAFLAKFCQKIWNFGENAKFGN